MVHLQRQPPEQNKCKCFHNTHPNYTAPFHSARILLLRARNLVKPRGCWRRLKNPACQVHIGPYHMHSLTPVIKDADEELSKDGTKSFNTAFVIPFHGEPCIRFDIVDREQLIARADLIINSDCTIRPCFIGELPLRTTEGDAAGFLNIYVELTADCVLEPYAQYHTAADQFNRAVFCFHGSEETQEMKWTTKYIKDEKIFPERVNSGKRMTIVGEGIPLTEAYKEELQTSTEQQKYYHDSSYHRRETECGRQAELPIPNNSSNYEKNTSRSGHHQVHHYHHREASTVGCSSRMGRSPAGVDTSFLKRSSSESRLGNACRVNMCPKNCCDGVVHLHFGHKSYTHQREDPTERAGLPPTFPTNNGRQMREKSVASDYSKTRITGRSVGKDHSKVNNLTGNSFGTDHSKVNNLQTPEKSMTSNRCKTSTVTKSVKHFEKSYTSMRDKSIVSQASFYSASRRRMSSFPGDMSLLGSFRTNQSRNSCDGFFRDFESVAVTVHRCENLRYESDRAKPENTHDVFVIARLGGLEMESDPTPAEGNSPVFEATFLYPFDCYKSLRILVGEKFCDETIEVIGIGKMDLPSLVSEELMAYHQEISSNVSKSSSITSNIPIDARLQSGSFFFQNISLFSTAGVPIGSALVSVQFLKEKVVVDKQPAMLAAIEPPSSVCQ